METQIYSMFRRSGVGRNPCALQINRLRWAWAPAFARETNKFVFDYAAAAFGLAANAVRSKSCMTFALFA